MSVQTGNMRFRHQILLLLLSIILLMMVAAVLVAVPAAFNAQQNITFDRLNSVSNLKTLWVMREFNELKRGLVALTDNAAIIDEVRFVDKLLPGASAGQSLIQSIRNADPNAPWLTGNRLSLYWQSYKRLYPHFRYMENNFPDSEVSLIRASDGLIFFNLLGGKLFMERIVGSQFETLPLYHCFRRARANPQQVVFEDFNYDDHSPVHRACAAKAVLVGDEVVAVLVHQFTWDLINSLMSLRPGLGETGETYLVGPDKLMRTESRFAEGDSILQQFVDSRAVREGLSGYAGSSITTNYRGARVFSVWQPIELDAIRWSLIAEIEEDESYSGVRETISQLLLMWWVGFLALVIIAYAFARRTEKPLLALVRNARRLAEGNFSGSIREGAGSRELRDLVRSFNNMGAQIRERAGALEAARRGAEHASWEADQANRAKSDFLSKMSHELRTPLNGVLGYAQILKRDQNMNEHQRETLDAIENCGQHLLELINDVLDIARIESGKLDMDIHPTNMRQLVQRVVDVVKPRAQEKGLVFEVDISVLPLAIFTDAMRLSQILINLLGNAVKFTHDGFVRLRVANDLETSILTFFIEDSGSGIPEHRLDEIFGPFSQTISGKRAGGAGLGLAISKQLSEALGGRLRASSDPGVGSIFYIELPYVLAGEQFAAKVTPPSDAVSLPDDVHFKVLVADDNATNRDIMVQLLENAGFDTLQAADGEEVLELLVDQSVDLILMDIRMPVIDGLTAARRIRRDLKLNEVKIIAVSATVLPNMQEEITQCGCDAFLAKPVDARILFAEIERQLNMRMLSDSSVIRGRGIDSQYGGVESLADGKCGANTLRFEGAIALDNADSPLENVQYREMVSAVLQDLAEAAAVGDIAAVRTCLIAVKDKLGDEHGLALSLQRHAERFDMQAIVTTARATLDQLAS
jgi:signal transduction histidine kinase/CheY-like chemotaxis protein